MNLTTIASKRPRVQVSSVGESLDGYMKADIDSSRMILSSHDNGRKYTTLNMDRIPAKEQDAVSRILTDEDMSGV